MPPFLVAGDALAYLLPDGTALFSDVTFAIGPKQHVALAGPNGVGKSSLARLITQECSPHQGAVSRHGAIAHLEQDAVPNVGLRIVDYLQIGDPYDALMRCQGGVGSSEDVALIGDNWSLEDALSDDLHDVGLEHLSPVQSLTSLSGGEWLRLQLLSIQRREPDLLILDEPSNHLDQSGRIWLESWLRDADFAWLLISHDRHLLDLPEEIWDLTPAGLDIYGGNYTHYLLEKTAQQNAANAQFAHAKRILQQAKRDHQTTHERQERKASRGKRARTSGSQPKIVLDGRKTRSEQTSSRLSKIKDARLAAAEDRIIAARAQVKDRTPIQFDAAASEVFSQQPVLTLTDVCLSYGSRTLFAHFDLSLRGPQRIHIAGENGSGKTTLLDLISGGTAPDAGTITRHVPLGYLLQQQTRLTAETSVDRCLAYRPDWSETDIRTSLARAGLRREKAVIPFNQLSAGERLRADLVRLLNCPSPARLLLLDEPSNHLDIDALDALEAALKSYRGSLLFTSHDPVFVGNMDVTHTVQLRRS